MKNIVSITIGSLFLMACNSSVQNVTTVKLNANSIVVLDEEKVTEKKTVKLSELIENFQIIRFEDKDEAFFKANWLYFSDNYICVRQSAAPIKFFEKSGQYIGNVGNVGQGPGEYKFIYDVLVDEKAQSIYVTSFSSEYILHYDLSGNYLGNIKLGGNINKGRLFSDSSVLSLIHLSFKDRKDKFTGANIQIQEPDSIQYVYVEEIASRMTDKNGKRQGFNDEKERGNLFDYICDIVEYHKPEYIFLENVANLKGHDHGNTWKVIYSRLHDELGYDVQETINSLELFDFVIDTLNEKLTDRLLREYHSILKKNTSDETYGFVGTYKKIPNKLRNVNIELAQPYEVEELIKVLLEKKITNIYDIANFHQEFEHIHPFQDGNGRIGRFIILRQCIENGVDLIAIDDEYNKEYRDALYKAQTTGDLDELVDVFEKCQKRLDEKLSSYIPIITQLEEKND